MLFPYHVYCCFAYTPRFCHTLCTLQCVALGGVVLRVASITTFILAWEILGILPGRGASFFKPDSLRDRKPDIEGYNCWVDQLDRSGLDRNALLNIILDTGEFKKISDDYYRLVEMHKGKLTIYREDIGNKYGKQSYLSGFIIFN